MAVYQLYKLIFDCSSQRNLYAVSDGCTTFQKAQDILEGMLKGVKPMPLTKEKRDKTLVPLDNYVEAKHDGVTVLVICNEKSHKYKEKMEDRELEYHPGCRVIIDNRPGIAQIAIERSGSFDEKTEKVRDLLQEALCKAFSPYELVVEVRAKKREGTFWDAVDEQCNVYCDTVTQVTFDFPNDDVVGPIDAPKQTLEKLAVLRSFAVGMNAARGVYQAFSDKKRIIHLDKTQEDIAHMVGLCCNNGYNISVHFKHYGVYRYGTDIKALSQLKENVIKEFISGQMIAGRSTQGEWALIHWLDEVRKVTENYKDEEPTQKKRTRSRKG